MRPNIAFAVLVLGLLALVATPGAALAQPKGYNYDEAKVPAYTLPDPLVFADGTKVESSADWIRRRREIVALFESQMFGRSPGKAVNMSSRLRSVDPKALGGKATRKEITILLTGKDDGPKIEMLYYTPNQGKKPFPCVVGLNFNGNQAIANDPGITLASAWMSNNAKHGVAGNRASEKTRGVEASRWQLEMVIEKGYALATAYYGDLYPDYDHGFEDGVHAAFDKDLRADGKRSPDAWGAIAAWAWGLSHMVDVLERDTELDNKKFAVIGHSRLGKAALWAGAMDARFALVISNNSGAGGAALSKRIFGETVARLNTSFPHWFCENFKKYNDKEADLPMDQHQLLALIAPRALYVGSAEEDLWADPKGEFLACVGADPVYKLLGTEGLPGTQMPKVNEPVMGRIAYHNRSGKHDVTEYDWKQYLAYADKLFKR